ASSAIDFSSPSLHDALSIFIFFTTTTWTWFVSSNSFFFHKRFLYFFLLFSTTRDGLRIFRYRFTLQVIANLCFHHVSSNFLFNILNHFFKHIEAFHLI